MGVVAQCTRIMTRGPHRACEGETAKAIVKEGYDFRFSIAGSFGEGVYFDHQPRKSHQYGGETGLRPVLISRVALGDANLCNLPVVGRLEIEDREIEDHAVRQLLGSPLPVPPEGHRPMIKFTFLHIGCGLCGDMPRSSRVRDLQHCYFALQEASLPHA